MAEGDRQLVNGTQVGWNGTRSHRIPAPASAGSVGFRCVFASVFCAVIGFAAVSLLFVVTAQTRAADVGSSPLRNIAVEGEPALFTPLQDVGAGNAGMFVGVNKFTNKQANLRPLEFAVHDAIEQAYLFVIELRLIPPRNCCLALSGDASHDTVRNHLRELERAKVKIVPADSSTILSELQQITLLARQASDLLIVSFCSHGFDQERVAYVMPENGLRGFLKATALPLPTIEEEMDKSKAGHRLLLVDACQERAAAGGKREIGDQPPAGMSQTFQAALARPTGQAKLASCSVGEYSYEDASLGGVGHGVFTFALLESLRGGAQAGPDNLIRLQAVANYTQRRVEAWVEGQNRVFPDSPKKQSPSLHGQIKTRELPLAEKTDNLTALLERIQRVPATDQFDAELKQRLLGALRNGDLNREAYRDLRATTVQFLAGAISEGYFVTFLKGWFQLRQEIMAGGGKVPASKPPPKEMLPRLASPADEVTVRHIQRACAEALGRNVVETKGPGGLQIQFALVPPGSYRMGSDQPAAKLVEMTGTDERFFADEQPPHAVVISRPFWISQHEITTAQFGRFADQAPYRTSAEKDPKGGFGWNAAKGKFEQGAQYNWREVGWPRSDDHPVVNVSWDDAVAFCQWLTQQDSSVYRLPTEAEWEYACRAGTSTLFSSGDDPDDLTKIGNVADATAKPHLAVRKTLASSDGHAFSTPVGQFQANGFGLYDMHGNVWEWCADHYGENYYQASPLEDPKGPDAGELRVLRGGAWSASPWQARCAFRNKYLPSDPHYDYGFRVVCECK